MATSRILRDVRIVKMTGLLRPVVADLQDLRLTETEASFSFRVYTVILLTFCEFQLDATRKFPF